MVAGCFFDCFFFSWKKFLGKQFVANSNVIQIAIFGDMFLFFFGVGGKGRIGCKPSRFSNFFGPRCNNDWTFAIGEISGLLAPSGTQGGRHADNIDMSAVFKMCALRVGL